MEVYYVIKVELIDNVPVVKFLANWVEDKPQKAEDWIHDITLAHQYFDKVDAYVIAENYSNVMVLKSTVK